MDKYQVCSLCTGQFAGKAIHVEDDGRDFVVCSEKCKRLLIAREDTKRAARIARRLRF